MVATEDSFSPGRSAVHPRNAMDRPYFPLHELGPSSLALLKHVQQSLLLIDAQGHVQVNLVAVLAHADFRFNFSYLDMFGFLWFCHAWKSSTMPSPAVPLRCTHEPFTVAGYGT